MTEERKIAEKRKLKLKMIEGSIKTGERLRIRKRRNRRTQNEFSE